MVKSTTVAAFGISLLGPRRNTGDKAVLDKQEGVYVSLPAAYKDDVRKKRSWSVTGARSCSIVIQLLIPLRQQCNAKSG